VTNDNTTARMAGALAAVANGASPRAAADAHNVTRDGLYKAMARHGIRPKCPTCGQRLTFRRDK